jgi:hypothetical protein
MEVTIDNKTCLPSEILEPLIAEALKTTNCKHEGFRIKFTAGKYLRGTAYRVGTWCRVVLPISQGNGISFIWNDDPDLAEQIFRVIVHELDHISDYQHGINMGRYYQRKEHKPCELRALAAESEAVLKMSEGLLDELEKWLESKRRNPK